MKKTVKISEKQLRNIISESISSLLNEEYREVEHTTDIELIDDLDNIFGTEGKFDDIIPELEVEYVHFPYISRDYENEGQLEHAELSDVKCPEELIQTIIERTGLDRQEIEARLYNSVERDWDSYESKIMHRNADGSIDDYRY